MKAVPLSALRRGLGAAVIALAVYGVVQPALHGGWIWDDLSEVIANLTLRDRSGLGQIWVHPPGPDYLPLKSSVQWLEWRLWGDHPLGYHWASACFHLAGALLVWRVLHRLGARLAWIGGLLFAVHPLAVESVAWISEQKNTLSLPLLLLAADAYLDFDAGNSSRFACWRSLGWFIAALLAKSSVVMFPAIILLYVWWRRGRWTRRDLAASAPFFAVSLALGLVTVWFQVHRAIAGAAIASGSALFRVAVAGRAAVFYLSKALAPHGLMPIYPAWAIPRLSAVQFLPWFLLLAGTLVLLAGAARRAQPIGAWCRALLFGLGFFLINLLPVLGFVPLSFSRLSPVSDHFAYLSLVGICGLAAAACGVISTRIGRSGRWEAGLLLGLIFAGLITQSRSYARVFQSGSTLWGFAAVQNPNSLAAHYNLANARVLAGHPEQALLEFESALKLAPDFAEGHSNLGDTLVRLGRKPEAVIQYEAALRSQPGLFLTRDKLGNLLWAQGRTAEALEQYQAAVAVAPDAAGAQADLAYALAQAGRLGEAARHYQLALKLDPTHAESWDELGTVLAMQGDGAAAIADYQRALQLRPGDAEAHNNLGLVFARAGRRAEAIAQFEAALRLKPDFALAGRNLENARQMSEGREP